MAEKWKPVKGFPNYKVSDKGNVLNVPLNLVKSQRNSKTGYKIVDLKYKGKKETRYVHRLVAEAFIPNPNNYPCVNHKNEDKTDNKTENLEWCTVYYNNHYGNHIEKIKKTKIEKYGLRVAKVCPKTNKILKVFKSLGEAAETAGVTIQALVWALAKSSHTSGGFKWREVI